MADDHRPQRLRLWKVALLSTAAYHPVFAYDVFKPARLRGGDWGDILWEGMKPY